MTKETKVTLSAIAYFLLFVLLNVVYLCEVYPLMLELDEAAQAAISFTSVYFLILWAGVTVILPLISYSFLHMRREGATGLGYKLVRHFFLTNLGFSALGFIGIVYEGLALLFH